MKALLLLLQGKRIQDVAFRMHVAQPKPRDRQGRPPVIPTNLAAARARKDAGEKKRTEKDVEVGCLGCLTQICCACLAAARIVTRLALKALRLLYLHECLLVDGHYSCVK